ncbi:non-ribosomal peptide synthetase, partial [Vibrio zhanjiangensis]|uniref:non-ribosomal peptide synthetase n=1 Tax=Vibrio zhanjiangensis TaxID=1046128 RepID=UPI0024E152FC
MGLHALFAALLSRYSNETDIVVGSPVANREQPEIAPLIGFFVNTLVLRADLSEAPSFNTLLTQCRATALDAYAHQQVPFEQLVEVLQPNRHLSHHPLFQVMLALQNNDTAELNLPGVEVQFEAPDLTIAKFDLTLNVVQDANGLALDWEYNQDLFKAETVARLAGHFEALLQAALTQPERPLAELDILTVEEKQQQLVEWNDTQQDFPSELCIHQLVEAQAAEQPDATALVFNQQSLSYGELNQRANQLAHYLLEQGVRRDTLVGLCAERSFEMMIGLLGILKAGGAYVPLDPSYPSERLGHMIEDSGVGVIITQQHLIHDLPKDSAQASYRTIALDCSEVQQQLSHYIQENIDPTLIGLTSRHLAYVIYTSGSTGKPKGVLVEHRGVINAVSDQVQRFDVTRTSRIGQIAAISFDTSVLDWSLALSTGAALYLYPHDVILSPSELSNRVAHDVLTHCILTPALLPHLDSRLWESVQTLVVGGDQCALEVAQAWSEKRRFFNAYGPTEATIDCCVFEYKGSPSVLPIGRPINNVEVYVLSPEQQLVPIGVPGELYVGGVGLARGYLNRPELTADKFIAHPFSDDPDARLYRTGDLVRWLPDGNLVFLGRLDHQVKIRGFRIELGEIESQLLREPSVKEAVVLAREDRGGDKRLVAYVTAAETPEALDEGTLMESLRQRLKAVLPDYMVPSAFVVLEQLPLTPNGKVDRKALPEPDLAQVTGAYEAPQSLTEARLAELWQTLLHLNSPVSRDAHFFELGGHSLLGVRLLAGIREQFALDIPIKTLFAQPILSELAVALDAEASMAGQAIQVPPMVARDPQLTALPLSYA